MTAEPEAEFVTLKERALRLMKEGYDTAEAIEEAGGFQWMEIGIVLCVLKEEGLALSTTRHGVTRFRAVTDIKPKSSIL